MERTPICSAVYISFGWSIHALMDATFRENVFHVSEMAFVIQRIRPLLQEIIRLFGVSIFQQFPDNLVIILRFKLFNFFCFRFLYAKSASLNSKMSSPTLWYKKMSLHTEYLRLAALVLSLLHLSQAIGKFIIIKCDPNPNPL